MSAANNKASHKRKSIAAVVKCLGTDNDGGPLYSWRRCNGEGRWLEAARQGDVLQLNSDLSGSNREICLLLPGAQVITAQREFSSQERKHIRRLLPFELEDEVTTEVEDLHFAFGDIDNGLASLAYVEREFVAEHLQLLASNGIEVLYCVSEPLMLPYLQNTWTLRWADTDSGSRLDVRYAQDLGFSIDGNLAAVVLAAFCQNNNMPESLYLIADGQDSLQSLHSLLPESLTSHVIDQQIDTQLLDEWDSLDLQSHNSLDLCQGEFARRLPVKRWMQEWRSVAAIALVAVVAYVAVNVGQVQYLKSARTELEAQKLEVARQVIPEGYIQDASKQISDKLSGYRNTEAFSNSVQLLSLVTPIAAEAEKVNIGELRYTQQRGDLSLVLEADTDSAIESFRSKLANKKLMVDPPKISARGDKYRAQMVVRTSN